MTKLTCACVNYPCERVPTYFNVELLLLYLNGLVKLLKKNLKKQTNLNKFVINFENNPFIGYYKDLFNGHNLQYVFMNYCLFIEYNMYNLCNKKGMAPFSSIITMIIITMINL